MFARGKRNKLTIEKALAFQIRSSATEIPPHSCGKASGCFCSRGIHARPGYQMLPRRPSVSGSAAIDESASVHCGLAHRSIRFPIAGSDFCADAKADAKKYTALTIGARFSPGDVCLGTKGSRCLCGLIFAQIFFRNRILGAFLLPINAHDPPATAVVEQLYAVNPTHKRFGITRVMARLVDAPDMRDTPELFCAPRNLLFVKSVLRKIRFHARNEAIYVQQFRRELVIRAGLCGRD